LVFVAAGLQKKFIFSSFPTLLRRANSEASGAMARIKTGLWKQNNWTKVWAIPLYQAGLVEVHAHDPALGRALPEAGNWLNVTSSQFATESKGRSCGSAHLSDID
jgi:hypothetical protein